ncbi:hypothetical protein ACIRL0_12145 [Streptomyces sp. NPDC102365]|uniref:hypothetical protein n=1 Tax=Streptomyces sp. NPDC102365 TaxID=3366162 RepID=UPI0037F14848
MLGQIHKFLQLPDRYSSVGLSQVFEQILEPGLPGRHHPGLYLPGLPGNSSAEGCCRPV